MQATEQAEVLQFILIDQQKSTFYLEGSDKDGKSDFFLMAPSFYRFPKTSTMVEMVDGRPTHVPIRWIPGCDEIRVAKQDERKILPTEDEIWFKNGELVVADGPENSSLLKFMMKSALLEGNPDAPKGAKPRIAVKKPFEEAANDNVFRRAKALATSKVTELSWDGKDGMEYDTERINFLASLFQVVGTNPGVLINGLYAVAETAPDKFLKTIADSTAFYRAMIGEALHFNVINIDADAASYMDSKTVITQLKAKKKDAKLDELATYLMSLEGQLALREIQTQLEAAKKKSADPVK